MLQNLYSVLHVCYDAVHMLIGIVCTIFESTFHIFKPPALKPVEGEIALVVGASQGVGREFAVELASLGAVVVCWDVDKEANQETVKAARSAQGCRGKTHAYHCDVSDRDQVLRTARLVQKEVGDVSILIQCNSAESPRSSLAQFTHGLSKVMATNVFSHFWVSRPNSEVLEAFLPAMKERNHGHVVLLSSVAGLNGIGQRVMLHMSQFAMKGLAESLKEELRVTGLSGIHLTLAHVHPSIVSHNLHASTLARVSRYFGLPAPKEVAHEILKAMRRNYAEVSIPEYILHLGNILRMLPPKASVMLRKILDVAVETI